MYIILWQIATHGNHRKNDIHFCLPNILLYVSLLLNSQFNFPTVLKPRQKRDRKYSQVYCIFSRLFPLNKTFTQFAKNSTMHEIVTSLPNRFISGIPYAKSILMAVYLINIANYSTLSNGTECKEPQVTQLCASVVC